MRKEETVTVDLLHRDVPARQTDQGLRALSGESPICDDHFYPDPDYLWDAYLQA
jgi:hypothetical protein